MMRIPQEQPEKKEVQEMQSIRVEVPKTSPEMLSSFHDILGREYDFNGILFTVLGMDKVFYRSEDEGVDIPLHTFSIARFRSVTLPLIPFCGGVACITKIDIGDRVIVGCGEIVEIFSKSHDLPMVNPRTGIYIDSEGREWMSASPLARLVGFSSSKVISRSGISSIAGIDGIGRENTLYNVQDARALFHERNELPRVDYKTGIYTDREEREWMSPSRFSQDFGISFRKVLSLMKDAPSIKGICNKVVLLYPLDRLLDICPQESGLPIVDKETNIYTDPEDGTQWAPATFFAKKFSLFYETVKNYFQRDCVPSRKGIERSGRKTELFAFEAGKLSLENIASLPMADSDGYYRDVSGIVWAPLGIIKKQYHIDVGTIAKLIASIPSLICRDRSGSATTFYRLDHVGPCIEPYISYPRVEPILGYYEDSQDQRWVPIKYFQNKYGIGNTTFRAYAGHVRAIDGRVQGSGGITKLYHIEEAEEALQSFLSLLAVDKDTGMVQDEHGVIWITENGFCASHGISNMKLHTLLDGVPSQKGRGANGMKSSLYRLDILQERAKDFLSLPVVDKKTGIYRDDSGKRWASLNTIAEINDVTQTKLEGYVSRISSLLGRDKTGGECLLYSVYEYNDVLREFSKLPRVDKRTGIYTDTEERQWMAVRPLADRLGIGECLLKTFENVMRLRGRDRVGKEVELLNMESAEYAARDFQQLPLVNENGMYIDTNGIEWQQIDKASARFGVSRNFVERNITSTRIGRTSRNIRTKLCRVNDIESLLRQRNK